MNHNRNERPSNHDRRDSGSPVPLINRTETGLIYHRRFTLLALAGALVFGLLFGLLGYAFSTGWIPLAGFGQFSASGVVVATFTAAGAGVALGGLAGGIAGLFTVSNNEVHPEGTEDLKPDTS